MANTTNPCMHCKGAGKIYSWFGPSTKCPLCNGDGYMKPPAQRDAEAIRGDWESVLGNWSKWRKQRD